MCVQRKETMANTSLHTAKAAKNDEFYTRLEDIIEEMSHYTDKFRGKVVYCNCDDPTWSNFWKYLHNNFSVLGLKKLISTHYEADGSPSYKMEYEGGDDLNTEVGTITPLKGNGDFRSEECMEILCSCDVVITNPPFSLFVPYINHLLEYEKPFILIANKNALHNKDLFPYIRDNKAWVGQTPMSKDILFTVPKDRELELRKDKSAEGSKYRIIGDTLFARSPSIWMTNVDIKKRHQPFFPPEDAHCYYEGNEDKYPKYYNFDGIDVAKTELIPIDYEGYMGVPVSFLDKYNPDDFELIGLGSGTAAASIGVKKNYRGRTDIEMVVDGVHKCPFSRIIIRNRHPIPAR